MQILGIIIGVYLAFLVFTVVAKIEDRRKWKNFVEAMELAAKDSKPITLPDATNCEYVFRQNHHFNSPIELPSTPI